jgi:MoaA/NifB/PqqE/SkfB family radical SAM enzyme
MVGPMEIARRVRGRVTGELASLPVLALSVHSACNCRCVMCDIWKANTQRREISAAELDAHVADIGRLHVQRVMLTGGEPLLHRNLWTLCDRLQRIGVRVTLVTTGLLVEAQAADIARSVDTVVISLDGPREVHDAIRRVKGGFEKVARGVMALRAQPAPPRLIARSVVQRDNCRHLGETIAAAQSLGFDELSFLAADVWSSAFNRTEPWPAERQAEIAIPASALQELSAAIARAHETDPAAFSSGFVVGGRASLNRIHDYYRAVAGLTTFPEVRCNAPWVSAVLEPGGVLRPCFFHDPYAQAAASLTGALNADEAIAFRRHLDVRTNTTCQRCVCSLNLPLTQTV